MKIFIHKNVFLNPKKPPGNVETTFFQVFWSAILENRKICWGEKMKIFIHKNVFLNLKNPRLM